MPPRSARARKGGKRNPPGLRVSRRPWVGRHLAGKFSRPLRGVRFPVEHADPKATEGGMHRGLGGRDGLMATVASMPRERSRRLKQRPGCW